MSLVLVTESEFRKAEDVFRAAAPPLDCRPAASDEDALAAAVIASGARHVVVGHRPYRGSLYDALAPGSVIARFGVGYDGIDTAKAASRGLICTNTPGVARSIGRRTRHAADRRGSAPVRGASGANRSGRVDAAGRCRARRKDAGDHRQRPDRPRHRPHRIGRLRHDRRRLWTTGERSARRVLTHHHGLRRRGPGRKLCQRPSPTTTETRGFLNRERLALLRADAWLINTARGAVVDETALHDALATGRLAGAALDVFEREPYVPVDAARDLRRLPNVILTPHIGSHTTEANHAMARRALRNIELAESGRHRARWIG